MSSHSKEFQESARRYTADLHHRDWIQKALTGYYVKRDENINRFQSWQEARTLAAEIKWEAVNHHVLPWFLWFHWVPGFHFAETLS